MEHFNTYVTVDLNAIRDNLDAIRRHTGKAIMAVIKADAYGHGAVQIAHFLQNQCQYFGVASMLEALELRRAGIDTPILILGRSHPCTYADAVAHDVCITVARYEDACLLSEEAQRQGKTANVHLAVDTGMSRLGFQVTEEDADLCAAISRLPGICAQGLFSHFATADCADLSRTHEQIELFEQFSQMLQDRGVEIAVRHISNSAGTIHFGGKYDMVRCGIITYGLYPSEEVPKDLISLRPALSWNSRITNLRLLPAGRQISYGGTFVTEKETLVATIPAGYADGYRRALSGKFYVLIRGKKAPILGRICMDQMMVDVTDIPDVSMDDTVTLVGQSGSEAITVEQIAAAADSFNYEFVCGISRRVPRIYCLDGQTVAKVNYLNAR